MGIFGSKKKELARAGGESNTASRGFALGFRKVFGAFGKYVSCMFATAEQKTSYIDVYSRSSFNKSLFVEPGNGFSATDEKYAEDKRSNNFVTVGAKTRAFAVFDTDTWNDEEIAQYNKKFTAVQLNDEVEDMMKMSVDGLGADAEALENYGYDSEADIAYEEVTVPEVKPGFLPEAIREEKVEEVPVEMPVVEVPTETPVAEETEMPVEVAPVEIEVVEETAEEAVEIEVQPVAIDAPAVAGLLTEAKEETVEIEVQPVMEVQEPEAVVEIPAEPETKIEEPKEESLFSFGFGSESVEQIEPVAFTFGFGAEEEKAEESSFITNSILVSSETAEKASL